MFAASRFCALLLGIALPVLETVRRWHQLGDFAYWPTWLEDVLLGALLLFGWRLTSRHRYGNARYLAAFWGIACGALHMSFGSQLMRLNEPDPAPISSPAVAVVKGILFAITIVGVA